MDYTTLPSKAPLATDEENLQMVFSLYKALQELPDTRRAEAQTLRTGLHPVSGPLGETRRTEELEWSNRMAPSSAGDSGTSLWTSADKPALPDDLLQRLS